MSQTNPDRIASRCSTGIRVHSQSEATLRKARSRSSGMVVGAIAAAAMLQIVPGNLIAADQATQLQTTRTMVSTSVNSALGNASRDMIRSRNSELMVLDHREVDEIAARLKEIIDARYDVDNLNAESFLTIEELRMRISELESIQQQASSEQQSLSAERASIKDQLNQIMGERDSALDELNAMQAQMQAQLGSLQALESETQSASNRIAEQSQQIEVLSAERDLASESLEMTTATLEGVQQSFNESEATAGQLRADVDQLISEKAALQARSDAALLSRDQLHSQINEVSVNRDEIAARVTDLNAQLEALQFELDSARDGHADLEAEIVSRDESTADLNQQLAQIKERLESSEAQFAKDISARIDKINKLQARLASSVDRLSDLDSQNTQLSQDNQGLRDQLADSQQNLSQTELQLGNAHAVIGEHQADLDVANAKLRELAIARQEAEAERARIATEAESLRLSLTGELEQAKLENITVQNARADNSIPLRLGNADFFETGSAELTPSGAIELTRLAEIIHTYHDRRIVVEGHTDTVPIGVGLRKRYASNWELSVARAAAAVRHMQKTTDIPPESMMGAGYGEYRPAADNGTPEGRRQNRRIEVVLYPDVSEYQSVSALED